MHLSTISSLLAVPLIQLLEITMELGANWVSHILVVSITLTSNQVQGTSDGQWARESNLVFSSVSRDERDSYE